MKPNRLRSNQEIVNIRNYVAYDNERFQHLVNKSLKSRWCGFQAEWHLQILELPQRCNERSTLDTTLIREVTKLIGETRDKKTPGHD